MPIYSSHVHLEGTVQLCITNVFMAFPYCWHCNWKYKNTTPCFFPCSFKVCSALRSVWLDTESCLSVLKRTWPSTCSSLQLGWRACWPSLKSSSLESDLHSLASNLVWGCGGAHLVFPLPYFLPSAWGHFHTWVEILLSPAKTHRWRETNLFCIWCVNKLDCLCYDH